MGIEDFFRHRCTICPSEEIMVVPAYGLPISDKVLTHKEPSYIEYPCYFGTGTAPVVVYGEPTFIYDGCSEISLPNDTNIKRGDKIIDIQKGIEYLAGFPEDIRGKYMFVPLERSPHRERL